MLSFARVAGMSLSVITPSVTNSSRKPGRAGLQPVLEKAGLIANDQGLRSGRRPADILIRASPRLKLSTAERPAKVALDIGVASPFVPSRLQQTRAVDLAAAAERAEKTRQWDRTQERCRAEGLGFEPVIFEATGGIQTTALRLLHSAQGRDSGPHAR